MKTPISLMLIAVTASLAGCGGGGAPAANVPPPVVVTPPVVVVPPVLVIDNPVIDNSTVRGTLVQSPPPITRSLSQSGVRAAAAKFGTTGTQLMAVAGNPQCGIDIHQVEYATVSAAGEPTRASAAMMVPTGSAAACTGKLPLLVFGHGTSTVKDMRMGDLEPRAPYAYASMGMAAMFAARVISCSRQTMPATIRRPFPTMHTKSPTRWPRT